MNKTAAILMAIILASCGSSLKSTDDSDVSMDIHPELVAELPTDLPPDPTTEEPTSTITWGKTTTHMIRGPHTDVKMMGGTTPDIENMVVTTLYYDALDPGTLTIALYTGGALDNAQGATRITEAHNISASAGWNEIDVPDVPLPPDTVAWIAWAKTGSGAQTLCSDNPAHSEDFQSARGRFTMSGTESYGGENALPETVGAGSFSGSYWHDVYAEIVIE